MRWRLVILAVSVLSAAGGVAGCGGGASANGVAAKSPDGIVAAAKGTTSTVDGQKVVAVRDTTQGGTLYVATTGKPYPVEISKAGAQGGQFVFDRYNEPVSLSAPPRSIDVSQLG